MPVIRTSLTIFIIIHLSWSLHTDRIKIDERIPEFTVPCPHRFELYRSHLTALIEFDLSARLETGAMFEQIKNSLVSRYMSTAPYFESLSDILDKVLVQKLSNIISTFKECPNVDIVVREHCVAQTKIDDSILNRSYSDLSASGELDDHFEPELDSYDECARKTYFEMLIDFSYVKIFENEDPKLITNPCRRASLTSAQSNLERNKWAIKAMMNEFMQKETEYFLNNIRNVIRELLEDNILVRRVFFAKFKSVKLVDITYTSGDRHKESGSVSILKFQIKHQSTDKTFKFRRVVFKPSSVLIDWLISGETKLFCNSAGFTAKSKTNFLRSASKTVDITDLKDINQQKYLKTLCSKLKGKRDAVGKLPVGSFIEMLNDKEHDQKKHLRVYKVLPIEDLHAPFPNPSTLASAHNKSPSAQTDEADSLKQAEDARLTLQEYMRKRLSKAHGYIEYLASDFTQTASRKQIRDALNRLPSSLISFDLRQKFLGNLDKKHLAFTEDDISLYSNKVGRLAEVLHLLSSTDIHCENVIVGNKDPKVIDHENSFNPTSEDRALDVAYKYERSGFNLELVTDKSYIYMYSYTKHLRKMDFVPEIDVSQTSRPFEIQIYHGEFARAQITYDEDARSRGHQFVLNAVCSNDQLTAQKGKPHDSIFRDWIEAPIMSEVIVREVNIGTGVFYNVINEISKNDFESRQSYLRMITDVNGLASDLTGQDSASLFRDNAELADDEWLIRKSNSLIYQILDLFDFENPHLLSLVQAQTKGNALIGESIDNLVNSLESIEPVINFIKNYFKGKSSKVNALHSGFLFIQELKMFSKDLSSWTSSQLNEYEQLISHASKLVKIANAFFEYDEANEKSYSFFMKTVKWLIYSNNNGKLLSVEAKILSPTEDWFCFNFKDAEINLLTEEHRNLKARESSTSGYISMSNRDRSSFAEVMSALNRVKASIDSQENSGMSSDHTDESDKILKFITALMPEDEEIHHDQDLDDDDRMTERSMRSSWSEDVSEHLVENSRIKQSFEKAKAFFQKGFDKYREAMKSVTRSHYRFANYILRENMRNKAKQNRLSDKFLSLVQRSPSIRNEEFVKGFAEFESILRRVRTSFAQFKRIWTARQEKIPRIVTHLSKLFVSGKNQPLLKNIYSILNSDVIDMLAKGLVPAFYALASDTFLYTPKGSNILAGVSKRADYPQHKFTDWLERLIANPPVRKAMQKPSFSDDAKLKAGLKQLLSDLRLAAAESTPYYNVSPLKHISAFLEKHITECPGLNVTRENQSQSKLLI